MSFTDSRTLSAYFLMYYDFENIFFRKYAFLFSCFLWKWAIAISNIAIILSSIIIF